MLSLALHSGGGLVYEAMRIGDEITKHSSSIVMVQRGGRCFSSCVLIYAAGKIRAAAGSIGIHRPFSYEITDQNLSYEKILDQYEKIFGDMTSYLGKHGVSKNVVELMRTTSSDDIRILSDKEMKDFGLTENIADKEYQKSLEIRVCGKEFYEIKREFYDYVDNCATQKHCSDGSCMSQCFKNAGMKVPDYYRLQGECAEKLKLHKQ